MEKRIALVEPGSIRSSPVIAGPSFASWTSIAIHEPTRAWPWSRTRAVIVSWPAPATGSAKGRIGSSPKRLARISRCARFGVWDTQTPAWGRRGSLNDAETGSEVAPSPFPRRRLAIVRSPTVPDVKPFRALRYAPDAVPDLAAVVAPPYDVIDAEARRRLAARDPRNAVRIDLPVF